LVSADGLAALDGLDDEIGLLAINLVIQLAVHADRKDDRKKWGGRLLACRPGEQWGIDG